MFMLMMPKNRSPFRLPSGRQFAPRCLRAHICLGMFYIVLCIKNAPVCKAFSRAQSPMSIFTCSFHWGVRGKVSGPKRGLHLGLGLPPPSQVLSDWAEWSSTVTRDNKNCPETYCRVTIQNGEMGEPGLMRPQATPRLAAPGNHLRRGRIFDSLGGSKFRDPNPQLP